MIDQLPQSPEALEAILPVEGIATTADRARFTDLLVLCHSVREAYPVPIVCFDAGLELDEVEWLRENIPNCSVEPLPAGASRDARATLVTASPFRRTVWLDPDVVVLKGLADLFRRLDSGPAFSGHPDVTVSAWDLERDRDLLEAWARGELELDERQLEPELEAPVELSPADVAGIAATSLDAYLALLKSSSPETSFARPGGGKPDPALVPDLVAARTPGRADPHRPAGEPGPLSLVCMMGVRSSPYLVETFLDHYHRLGVDRFLIILHAPSDDPRGDGVRAVLARYGAAPVLTVEEFSVILKRQHFADIVSERCSPDDWVVYADVDELQAYSVPLPELLSECERLGYAFVKGRFADRLAPGGRLTPVLPAVPIWEQFPFTAPVTEQLAGGWTGKICVAKARIDIAEGAHAVQYGSDPVRNYARTARDARAHPDVADVHHFKWDATLVERTREKLETRSGDRDAIDGSSFIDEYHTVFEHLTRHGQLAVGDLRVVGTPRLHFLRPTRLITTPLRPTEPHLMPDSLPTEGVVTLADSDCFLALVLLCHSVRSSYPVPVECYDVGLSDRQKAWIQDNLPTCTLREPPREGREAWAAPALIASSAFQRACWLDPGSVVLGGLGQLFRRLDDGPVFTGAMPGLATTPLGDAGVSGWDVGRDAAILSAYQPYGNDRIRQTVAWNLLVEPAGDLSEVSSSDADELLALLRDRHPDASVVRTKAIGSSAEQQALLASIAAMTPGQHHRPQRNRPVIRLVSMIGVKSSPLLVEAFLDHYYRLGVDELLIALHGEPGDPRVDEIEAMLRRYGKPPAARSMVYSVEIMHRLRQGIVSEHCSPGDWVVYADLDELHIYPRPLPDLLTDCAEGGYTFVRGTFVDRLAPGGKLSELEPSPSIWEQFPVLSRATEQVTGGWTSKVCAARASVRLGEGGGHTLDFGSDALRNYFRTRGDPRGYPENAAIHHFKWDATLRQRLYEKFAGVGGDREGIEGAGFMNEYRSLRDHLDRFGRIAADPVAVPPALTTPHYMRPSIEPGTEVQIDSQSATLARALALIEDGPENRWDAPSRLGRPGRTYRGALRRMLRPYSVRRSEFDRAVVEALSDLSRRQAELSARLATLPPERTRGR